MDNNRLNLTVLIIKTIIVHTVSYLIIGIVFVPNPVSPVLGLLIG